MVSFESLKSEYERNWANLEIRPPRLSDANGVARKAINGKATYQQVERLTGVPWYFAALCHYRESNFDFDTYLGNGETLHRATTVVPKGRGPFATFVDGAVDAFRIENFVGAHDWGIARILFRLERRSTASAITPRAAIRPIFMVVRHCMARPRQGPASSSATMCSIRTTSIPSSAPP
ncbi:lysozyme family protein [Bradyrhizobium sp. LM4.3]